MIKILIIILFIDRLISFLGYKICIDRVGEFIDNPCERTYFAALCLYKFKTRALYNSLDRKWYFKLYKLKK